MEAFILYIILMIGLVYWLSTKIKIINDAERIAVIRAGVFQKFLMPGLHIVGFNSTNHLERLVLGQLGNYLGDEKAQFGGAVIPVKFEEELKLKHGIEISRFEKDSVWVSPCNVRVVRCEKCGHQNQVAA